MALNSIEVMRVVASNDLSAQERARILEVRLEGVLDSAVTRPSVDVRQRGSNIVLQSDGVLLFTVTDRDAAAANSTAMAYALEARERLERGLSRAWYESTSRYFQTSSMIAVILMLVGLLLHVAIGRFCRTRLRTPGWLPRALMWFILVNLCLVMFPHTRGFGHALYGWLLQPMLRVALVILLTVSVWVVGRFLARGYLAAWQVLHVAETRSHQRGETWVQIAYVILNVAAVLSVGIGLLTAFRINPTTLLASAGIIGVALGVAAQDLLRDLTAGFAILVEDIYSVGDSIKIVNRNVMGTVVSINIRATTLRNTEGSLLTLPNSEMRVVENQTKQGSQADVRIMVAPGADNVKRALALMAQTGHAMREEAPEEVLAEPDILGVDDVGLTAVTLRMWLKTAAGLQFRVRRQLLQRLVDVFEKEGVDRPRVPLMGDPPPPPVLPA